jgi:methionine-rich copper-binding protein CopC
MLPLLIAVGSVPAAVIGVQAISSSMHPTAAAHARVVQVAAVKAPARTAPATVKVVMRDPGCHWFAVGASFKTKLAVTGTAKLSNLDEATLKIKGAGSVKRVNVGRTTALGRGAYTITMVGQKSDDNTLHLTVH